MSTSAEQLHNRDFNLTPAKTSNKKIFVDLDLLPALSAEETSIRCSYFYHPNNNGACSLTELATYALVCRRCEEPHCVNSCPVEALEQQKDKGKLLIRHNMRCVSCKSCSNACPYGTIYPEHLPLLIHNCDFCLDRLNQNEEPLCVKTCPNGALKLVDGDMALDANTFLVGDNLIVHSTHWQWEKA